MVTQNMYKSRGEESENKKSKKSKQDKTSRGYKKRESGGAAVLWVCNVAIRRDGTKGSPDQIVTRRTHQSVGILRRS